jgi:uncharacterized membrane protein YdfJ with MMPL/SSD domain
MEKPILSPDFTLEDIRKIRNYNAFLRQNMTSQEYIDYINKKASVVEKEIEQRKAMYNE